MIVFVFNNEEEKTKFEILYNTYKNIMFYHANLILNDTHLAEDALHKAFLKIFDNLHKINLKDSHKTASFLVTIVKRVSIDIYNKRKNDNLVVFDETYDKSIDEREVPDLILVSQEMKNMLMEKILDLPQNYMEVIMLSYVNEFTNKEISQILNISENNVRKRKERARKILIKEIEERGVYSE